MIALICIIVFVNLFSASICGHCWADGWSKEEKVRWARLTFVSIFIGLPFWLCVLTYNLARDALGFGD